jgi:hypothetical protein
MQQQEPRSDLGSDVPCPEVTQAGNVAVHSYRDSIFIARSPEVVFALVSDITRMGEWSPVCTGCWWDEGDGMRVGAWFTGRNEIPGRTWETRSQVVAAEPNREFAFTVGGTYVRWGYSLTLVEGGTFLEESWELLVEGLAMFATRFGADAPHEIDIRMAAAHHGIPVTLAAIKAAAESS